LTLAQANPERSPKGWTPKGTNPDQSRDNLSGQKTGGRQLGFNCPSSFFWNKPETFKEIHKIKEWYITTQTHRRGQGISNIFD